MMLQLVDVVARYDGPDVLHGISLEAHSGEICAVIGANGAGKSTTSRVVAGLVPTRAGSVLLNGVDVTQAPPHRRVRSGLSLVPAGRELFPSLSVLENLLLGAFTLGRRERKAVVEEVHGMFPILAERRDQAAGSLSGGEQQMLAIGRAMMAQPQILILDEPSMGLAPMITKFVLGRLLELSREGMGILLIEQNAVAALKIADRVVVLDRGRVTFIGVPSELAEEDALAHYYFGGEVNA